MCGLYILYSIIFQQVGNVIFIASIETEFHLSSSMVNQNSFYWNFEKLLLTSILSISNGT